MRLILIRHAESRHSFDQIIADVNSCRGLTDRGIAQAQRLSQRFRSTGELQDCRALVCSPVARARQTAELLGVAWSNLVVEELTGLREVLPGAADGVTWDEYRAIYGTFDLIAEPDRPFAPGGESWRTFLDRVRLTLDALVERFAGQTVVAITHAGFIVAVLLVLFAIPRPGTRARFEPLHTSLTEWQVADGVWRLERYNDAWHLNDQLALAFRDDLSSGSPAREAL
jgi:broad specificity phosphatase PhoE